MKKRILLLSFLLMLCLAGCAERTTVKHVEREPHLSLAQTLFQAQPETVAYPLEPGEPLSVALPLRYNGEGVDGAFYRELREATGVELELHFLPSEEYRMNLISMVASEEFPDLTWGFDLTLQAFEEELLELEDYIQTDAPNYLSWLKRDQETMASVLPDEGSVYQFYSLMETPRDASYMGPVVRQDLLDQYGLERPETYGDWEQVLLTLRDAVPDPLNLSYDALTGANWLCAGYDVSLAMGGLDRGFYQVDGVVKYGPLEPGFTDCVAMLRDWYDQGLITSRFLDFPDLSSSDYLLKMANGDSAIFFLGYDRLESLTAVSEIQGFQAVPLPDPVREPGQESHLCQYRGDPVYQVTFAISAACAQPERAVRFVDYLYSQEGVRLCCMGREGVTYTLSGGTPEFTALQDEQRLQENTSLVLTGVLLEQRYEQMMEPAFFQAQEGWMARKDGDYMLPVHIYYGYDDDETVGDLIDLALEMNTYAEQQLLLLISGQTPLEEIPNIQAKLREMGAEDCIAMVQDRVDGFYGR